MDFVIRHRKRARLLFGRLVIGLGFVRMKWDGEIGLWRLGVVVFHWVG